MSAIQRMTDYLGNIEIDPTTSEELGKLAVSAATSLTGPLLGTMAYLWPSLASSTFSHRQILADQPSIVLNQEADRVKFLSEVKALKEAAQISYDVDLYVAANYTFSSHGGRFSRSTPWVGVPQQFLKRLDGKSDFLSEKPEDRLDLEIHKYTDDETRFLIARQMAAITRDDDIVQLIVKTALVAAIVFACVFPATWMVPLAIFIVSAVVYVIFERNLQAEMDPQALQILKKRLIALGESESKAERRAFQAARSSLEKIRLQNLERKRSPKHSWYINSKGENRFIWNKPSIEERIERIEEMRPEPEPLPPPPVPHLRHSRLTKRPTKKRKGNLPEVSRQTVALWQSQGRASAA